MPYERRVESAFTGCFVIALAFFLINDQAAAQGGSQFYQRAPDVIPGTIPEMQHASFWINRMATPDAIILTAEGIDEINQNYQVRMGQLRVSETESARRIEQQLGSTPGLVTHPPDISIISPDSLADIVTGIISQQLQVLSRRSFGNILGIEYAPHELEEIENEMDFESLPTQINPRSGLTVTDVRLRIIPALRPEFTGLTQTGKTRWDVWNLDVLPIASPVEILYRSKSGAHLFILSDYGYGWVRSEAVAFANAEERQVFTQPDLFLVARGDRVPFYSAPEGGTVSGWVRMGARLPLPAEEESGMDEPDMGEQMFEAHVAVIVPVRLTDGKLSRATAWLAADSDVSSGYLPFTRRHVVEQAFRLNGRIYDWTGGWFGRNDGTVIRDIFKTFGFQMPANGVLLSMFTTHQTVVSPNLERSGQYEEIREAEPFLTVQASRSGHTLLYMGSYENDPIVFDTNGYGYENSDGDFVEIRRWGLSTLFVPDYFLNQEITMTEIR